MGSNDQDDGDEIGNLPSEAFDSYEEPFELRNEWLKDAPQQDQLIAMRAWFKARYCDPAFNTPYNGREGGYLFINGGPFDPADVLQGRFSGISEAANIQEVVDEMYAEVGHEWAPFDNSLDDFTYDERFDLEFSARDEPLIHLRQRLEQAQSLLALEGSETTKLLVQKLVFGAAIGALEAFLWETVDYWVEHDEQTLRDIVTRIPGLREQPMKLGDIFERHAGLKLQVKGYLQNLVWHRWDKVGPLFRLGLNVTLPSFKPFDEALLKRHDIVHRSGHDKDGNAVSVTAFEVQELCEKIAAFGTAIDGLLSQKGQGIEGSDAADF